MMTLEQIRQRNKAENAAAQRLQAAGYRLEGWDPRALMWPSKHPKLLIGSGQLDFDQPLHVIFYRIHD